MVLSTTKMTASVSSITNRNQGGGNKKAGLPPTADIPSSVYIAYAQHDGMLSLVNMRKTRVNGVSQSRPIGWSPLIKMY
jgi:hypothetical protein